MNKIASEFSLPKHKSIASRSELSTAYFFHTSGTSSGLPTPIPQSHHAAVGVLPALKPLESGATFSTTPLYHGGIADCFRAWTSRQPIWLFLEGSSPLTAASITDSISLAQDESTVAIKYFTSVPYILSLLLESQEGLAMLQEMDIVGVGGAALSTEVGDLLVKKGVHLVSRFGSAECGFMLSSDRDFATDTDWQYLRSDDSASLLSFEPREENLYELVVKPTWAYLSKTNREDGSFATADLFERHPTIPKAWRYHSRADAQIVLANGKKFDPSPIEASLLANTSLIRDAMIFGNNREYAGVLLFPRDSKDSRTSDEAWKVIKNLNEKGQNHTRIPRHMLILVSNASSSPLPKSSKGTIMRKQAERLYSNDIHNAYNQRSNCTEIQNSKPLEEVLSTIVRIFEDIVGRSFDVEADIYQQGVDSISCMQIRDVIKSTFVGDAHQNLPLNIVYESGSIKELASYLHRRDHGSSDMEIEDNNTHAEMENLTDQYSKFSQLSAVPKEDKTGGKVVLLTGATGMLGTYLLEQFYKDSEVKMIFCLLRASSIEAAFERVQKALKSRGILLAERDETSSKQNTRLVCLPCKLSLPKLGLSDEEWTSLASKSDIIIHAAWTVNFSLGVKSFHDHFQGTRTLVELSIISGAKMLFISSIATVSESCSELIEETRSSDPSTAAAVGYSQAKWVAEKICFEAYGQNIGLAPSQLSIVRVGQLCGDTSGRWNMSEAYPLILSTASSVNCLPDFSDVALDWLQVDKAAKIIVEVAKHPMQPSDGELQQSIPIYHVLNSHQTPAWSAMLRWIQDEDGNHHNSRSSFESVAPSDWISRLEDSLENGKETPKWIGLLHLWKGRWSMQTSSQPSLIKSDPSAKFSTIQTSKISPEQHDVKPITREAVLGIWNWVMDRS